MAEVDALREELAAVKRQRNELGVIVGSIEQIIESQWKHGRHPCPFCQSVGKHREMCYLFPGMGKQIIAEYEVIERQRDHLLGERERLNGHATPRRSLKSRLT
jgi:hypothetical protein